MSPRRPDVFAQLRAAAVEGLAGVEPLSPLHEPDPVRRAAGRLARERGHALERWCRTEHHKAERRRFAFVRQAGRPIIGHGPNGPVYGRAPADFVGQIRGAPGAPWLPLAIEAKAREERLQRGDLEPHQREHLEKTTEAGGVALVVVALYRDGDSGRWAIPWAELEARWDHSHGGASVGPEELRGWETRGDDSYLDRFAGGEGPRHG